MISPDRVILRFPRTVLALVAVITAVLGWYAQYLQVDFSVEQLFPQHDPDKDIYFQFRDEFTFDDDIFVVVYDAGDPFSPENLDLIHELTWELEDLDGIEQIISLANVDRITQEDGVLTVATFFPDDLTPHEIEQRKQELLEHPIYSNLVVSPDGKLGAILVNLDNAANTHSAREIILANIDSLRTAYPWKFYDAGLPVIRTRYVQLMDHERKIFLPVAIVISLLVLYGIFRQIRAVLVPLAAILVNLTWVAGLMAIFGVTINIISFITFNLLLIVGVSNAIHIMVKYYELQSGGMAHNEAIHEVIRRMGGAIFLTAFTTATGFFSLVITNIRIVQEFGVMLAVGAMLMFGLAITVIPAILSLIPAPDEDQLARQSQGVRLKAARQLHHWNEHHPRTIMALSLVVFLTALLGISRVDSNYELLEDLKPGNRLTDDLNFIEEHMGNVLPLEIVYDTGEPGGILKPENLKRLHRLQQFVGRLEHVDMSISAAEHVAFLNKTLGTGRSEIPASRGEIIDLLSLYDEALIETLIDFDYRKGRISARVANINSEEALEIKNAITRYADAELPAEHSLIITGTTLLALKINEHIVRNLVTSFLLAFVVIFVSMIALFRSLRLATISIFPNILPLLVAGGFMGFAGIDLRPTTAMTFAIAFGIGVDDTIHFLARFRQEFYRSGGHYRQAVEETLLTTGRAIITTTIVLLLGFSVLMFSSFVPQVQFSMIAGVILTVAMLASITILPVLITMARPKLKQAAPRRRAPA